MEGCFEKFFRGEEGGGGGERKGEEFEANEGGGDGGGEAIEQRGGKGWKEEGLEEVRSAVEGFGRRVLEESREEIRKKEKKKRKKKKKEGNLSDNPLNTISRFSSFLG